MQWQVLVVTVVYTTTAYADAGRGKSGRGSQERGPKDSSWWGGPRCIPLGVVEGRVRPGAKKHVAHCIVILTPSTKAAAREYEGIASLRWKGKRFQDPSFDSRILQIPMQDQKTEAVLTVILICCLGFILGLHSPSVFVSMNVSVLNLLVNWPLFKNI